MQERSLSLFSFKYYFYYIYFLYLYYIIYLLYFIYTCIIFYLYFNYLWESLIRTCSVKPHYLELDMSKKNTKRYLRISDSLLFEGKILFERKSGKDFKITFSWYSRYRCPKY